MITAAEDADQTAVIAAAAEYLAGGGDVLGGARFGADGWRAAIRWDGGAEQVIYLARHGAGFVVVGCRYALAGEALPEVWR